MGQTPIWGWSKKSNHLLEFLQRTQRLLSQAQKLLLWAFPSNCSKTILYLLICAQGKILQPVNIFNCLLQGVHDDICCKLGSNWCYVFIITTITEQGCQEFSFLNRILTTMNGMESMEECTHQQIKTLIPNQYLCYGFFPYSYLEQYSDQVSKFLR